MATEVALPKALKQLFVKREDEDWREWMTRQEEVIRKWEKEEGKTILRVPYADGYATYLVLSMKPLKIAHVPYRDAWHLPKTYIRGLRAADIANGRMPGGLPQD